MTTTTINGAVKVFRKDVDLFLEHWEKMQVEKPNDYPRVMSRADWYDQFECWLSIQPERKDAWQRERLRRT